jgi:hypothetical protein
MKEVDTGIEIDHEYTAYMARLNATYRRVGDTRPSPEILNVEPREEKESGRRILTVVGRNFKPETTVYLNRKAMGTRFISDTEAEIEVPLETLETTRSFVQYQATDGRLPDLVQRGVLEGRPTVSRVITSPEVVRVSQAFDLTFKFRAVQNNRIHLIHIKVTYPDGQTHAGYFEVSERESAEGSRTVPGFISEIAGTVKVKATLYAEQGHVGQTQVRFDVLPSNPFTVTITPSYTSVAGKNWRGAVRYDESENKYRCYVGVTFSNGFDFDVTVSPSVTVQVRDMGRWIYTAIYNRNEIVIPANSSEDTYFHIWYRNNPVTNVFDGYGDVVLRFTYFTSAGGYSAEAQWVMMGQTKVACIFVGDFTYEERTAVRNIVLNQASAIYEQRDLQITSAPPFGLPRDDPDWSLYRHILIDECKFRLASSEANNMRGDWSSPSSVPKHIDLWFVETFEGQGCSTAYQGLAPSPGPASKDGPNSGVVIKLKNLDLFTNPDDVGHLGRVIAHELGHYLGLLHVDDNVDANNIMTENRLEENYTDLTWAQHEIMVNHEWVQKRNP